MEPEADKYVFPKGRPRRRPIYYIAVTLHDGAVIASYPTRKPPPKEMKRHAYRLDADGILNDKSQPGFGIGSWEYENRFRFQDILANRLNTRRAIRELVLPVLEDLRQEVAALRAEIAQLSAGRRVRARKVAAKG